MNSGIGLAEYTNANFVSADTIYTSSIPYPTVSDDLSSSVTKVTIDVLDPRYSDASKTVKKDYYWKQRDGDSGYLLAGIGAVPFYASNNAMPWVLHQTYRPMDDLVHEGYADRLLPRAVGYSAALLNYFFRGAIEITLPDNGVYAITGPDPDGTFTKIHLNAKNTTAGGEPMTKGTIQLVVKYKIAQWNPFPSGNVPISDDFTYTVISEQNGITAIPSDQPVELTFDLSQSPIPLMATDVYLQVVYRGELGNEADAVAVGFKDISEPTPFDLVNDMDHVCINGSYLTAGEAPALTATDATGTLVSDVIDVYRHDLRNVYLAFFSKEATWPQTVANYSAFFASIPNGQYGRVFILTDYDFKFSTEETEVRLAPDDLWSHGGFLPVFFTAWGVRNQDDLTNGGRVHSEMIPFRGSYVWWMLHFENEEYPIGSECSDSSIVTAKPDITGPVDVVMRQ